MPRTMDKWIDGIVAEVGEEVRRAGAVHAPMNSEHEAKAVIEEEFDEFWELVKVNPKKLSREAQMRRLADMRKELVQVAAMAVRAICDLDIAELKPGFSSILPEGSK